MDIGGLAKRFSDKYDVNKIDSRKEITRLFSLMGEVLMEGEPIKIKRFGTFVPKIVKQLPKFLKNRKDIYVKVKFISSGTLNKKIANNLRRKFNGIERKI